MRVLHGLRVAFPPRSVGRPPAVEPLPVVPAPLRLPLPASRRALLAEPMSRRKQSGMGLFGPGMHDFVIRELEVGFRVAIHEDSEACGFGPLFDAMVRHEMQRDQETAPQTAQEPPAGPAAPVTQPSP